MKLNKAYWYKGKSTLRYVDSHSWSLKRPTDPDSPRKNPGYYFEWHFADENWIFYEGERQDEKREQLQPLMLRTRSIVPPEGGRPEQGSALGRPGPSHQFSARTNSEVQLDPNADPWTRGSRASSH